MNERDFAIWLNGWVELNGGKIPDAAQWKMIKEHLALLFNKVTPPLEDKKTTKLPDNIDFHRLGIPMPVNDPSLVKPVQPWYQPKWIDNPILGNNVITC